MTTTATTSDLNAALGSLLGAAVGVLIFVLILFIAALILEIIGLWKTFNKAGQPGWAAIIPFYNAFVLIKTAKMEWWHFLILFGLGFVYGLKIDYLSGLAGLATCVYMFVINIKLAKAFGRSAGLGVVCTLFPFIGYMILGCGPAKYEK